MPVYRFEGKVTVSTYTEVEAENYEEALKEAKEREAGFREGLTAETERELWVVEEVDGIPTEIYLGEVLEEEE